MGGEDSPFRRPDIERRTRFRRLLSQGRDIGAAGDGCGKDRGEDQCGGLGKGH
jgi:hypothetical protein